VPFNKGHHVIFERDQIVSLHIPLSIVADDGVEGETGAAGHRILGSCKAWARPGEAVRICYSPSQIT
jgi:hypothetical protein